MCCAAAEDFYTYSCECALASDDKLVRYVEAAQAKCTRVAAGEQQVSDQQLQTRLRGDGDDLAQQQPRLFLGVLSSSGNVDRRNAIRDTWGGDKRLYRVLFFVSRPRDDAVFDSLRKEATDKGDVVVLGHVWESYENITYQTFEVCRAAYVDGQATHVVKVDDDSYVRVGTVLREVAVMPRSKGFMGYIESPGGGPHRDPSNQWYVSREEWASDRYPPWAHGTGYVVTMDVAREIAAGVPYRLRPDRLFKLEDISFGSWVEFVAQDRGWDIQLVVSKRFNYGGCTAHDAVSHYIDAERQRCMWKRRGRCCPRVAKRRKPRHKDKP